MYNLFGMYIKWIHNRMYIDYGRGFCCVYIKYIDITKDLHYCRYV